MGSPSNAQTDHAVANARYWALYNEARSVPAEDLGEFLRRAADSHGTESSQSRKGKEPLREPATASTPPPTQESDPAMRTQRRASHPTVPSSKPRSKSRSKSKSQSKSNKDFIFYSHPVSPPTSPKRSGNEQLPTSSSKRQHAKPSRNKIATSQTRLEDAGHQDQGALAGDVKEIHSEEFRASECKRKSQRDGPADPMSIHAVLAQTNSSAG
ncbi:Nn.00g024350.m01.CDS01 [Neocucurbitaria sp. VM-36]